MTNFFKIILLTSNTYVKTFSKIGGNCFKRCITCANYEFLFSKMFTVFEIFVNEIV